MPPPEISIQQQQPASVVDSGSKGPAGATVIGGSEVEGGGQLVPATIVGRQVQERTTVPPLFLQPRSTVPPTPPSAGSSVSMSTAAAPAATTRAATTATTTSSDADVVAPAGNSQPPEMTVSNLLTTYPSMLLEHRNFSPELRENRFMNRMGRRQQVAQIQPLPLATDDEEGAVDPQDILGLLRSTLEAPTGNTDMMEPESGEEDEDADDDEPLEYYYPAPIPLASSSEGTTHRWTSRDSNHAPQNESVYSSADLEPLARFAGPAHPTSWSSVYNYMPTW